MLNWLFGNKKSDGELKEEVRQSFGNVRSDINNIGKWIKHLNEQDSKQDYKITDINERLSSIENEIEGIKNSFSLMDMSVYKQVFKTSRAVSRKQTTDEDVQIHVQTPVQTGELNLSSFSVMERALISVLLHQDMKLSYEDLAAMLGKNRATIRGQINAIKQKSELIEEVIEKNGKKRVFIPEEFKEKLLKNVKVRVSSTEKEQKKTKNDES